MGAIDDPELGCGGFMKKPLYIALISAVLLLIVTTAIVIAVTSSKKTEDEMIDTTDRLILDGVPNYTVIYREEYAKSAADLLCDELFLLSDVRFEARDGTADRTGNEIAIGLSSLSGAEYVDAANEIGNKGFKITFPEAGKVKITAFTEESAKNAVLCLIKEYLVKDANGELIFRSDLGYTSVEKDGAEPDASLAKTKKTLRFGEDGSFKILLFSDVDSGVDVNAMTVDTIEKMVEKEKPDLVLFAGNIQNKITDKSSLRELLAKISAPMESRSIPWAHVFGPDDAASGMSLDLQMEVYDEFEYCVSKKGKLSLDGVSNYFLPVFSSSSDEIKFGVWGFDSSQAQPTEGSVKIYGYISSAQTSWFLSTYAELTRQTSSLVPGIMFMCTPLPEFAELAESGGIVGNLLEDVFSPAFNSGLFAAALSTKNILGIYCGYDHLNDFSGNYYGIELAYLSSIGYDGYGLGGNFETNNLLRGARVLEINESDVRAYSSKMIYAADYGVSREAK